jgi:peptidoglycan/xylan/chitin deacetylase (PgdA/CDA1 family)
VTVPRRLLLLLALLALAGCGAARDAEPLPGLAITLTADDRAVWTTPPDGDDRVPVLLYHGIGERAGYASQADAYYALDPDDFAKQMALLDHAGYEAVTLEQFRAFAAGEDVALPEHPLLLTIDDSREDSWRNADAVLARHGWSAVMFADTGAIDRGAEEYVSWSELARMQRSGRWEIQLHAGRGHHNIPSAPGTSGPFYANRDASLGESLDDWRERVTEDLDWGEEQLRRHVPGYEPLAFAPPYGAYGQLATNDPAIPSALRDELRRRYGLVFVQEHPRAAREGDTLVPRLQLTRAMTGGDLHAWLATA